jgi:hypothetical protein
MTDAARRAGKNIFQVHQNLRAAKTAKIHESETAKMV